MMGNLGPLAPISPKGPRPCVVLRDYAAFVVELR